LDELDAKTVKGKLFHRRSYSPFGKMTENLLERQARSGLRRIAFPAS
jgi:hypothetical protein